MNTTRILRHINALRCLRLLRQDRAASRADMARELGLTRSTVGNAVQVLLDAGLVAEVGEEGSEGKKGRPAVRIKLRPEGAYWIGVDIGTRVLTCVVLDLQMGVVQQLVTPAGSDYRNPATIVRKVAKLAKDAASRAGVASADVSGLGVSVPGLVDHEGNVVNAPFLQWRDFPLRYQLEEALATGWVVAVRNDADAFAQAECATSTAGDSEHLLALLLAEGIGGALIHEGRVMGGAHGHAGEIGHTTICVNGRKGPLESFAGAQAFSHFFGADRPVSEGVAELLAGLERAKVKKALATWAEALATGLANAILLFDPGRIVLGGPLASLYPPMEGQVRAMLGDSLLPGLPVPPIAVTRFGSNGAAIGAAAVVRESVFALPDLEQGAPGPQDEAGPEG